jgi:hypothetical protein
MAFVREGVYQCLTGEHRRNSCPLFGIGHDQNGQRLIGGTNRLTFVEDHERASRLFRHILEAAEKQRAKRTEVK